MFSLCSSENSEEEGKPKQGDITEKQKHPASRWRVWSSFARQSWWGPPPLDETIKVPRTWWALILAFYAWVIAVIIFTIYHATATTLFIPKDVRVLVVESCYVSTSCNDERFSTLASVGRTSDIQKEGSTWLINGERSLRCHVAICLEQRLSAFPGLPMHGVPLTIYLARSVLNMEGIRNEHEGNVTFPLTIKTLGSKRENNVKVYLKDLVFQSALSINVTNGIVVLTRVAVQGGMGNNQSSLSSSIHVGYGPIIINQNLSSTASDTFSGFQLSGYIEEGSYCLSPNVTNWTTADSNNKFIDNNTTRLIDEFGCFQPSLWMTTTSTSSISGTTDTGNETTTKAPTSLNTSAMFHSLSNEERALLFSHPTSSRARFCPFSAIFDNQQGGNLSKFAIFATSVYINDISNQSSSEQEARTIEEELKNANRAEDDEFWSYPTKFDRIRGPQMDQTPHLNPTVLNKLANTKAWASEGTMRDFVQTIEVMTPSVGILFLHAKKRITMEITPEWLTFLSAYALRVQYRRLTSPLNHYRCQKETSRELAIPMSLINVLEPAMKDFNIAKQEYRMMLESHFSRLDQYEIAEEIFHVGGYPKGLVVFTTPEFDNRGGDEKRVPILGYKTSDTWWERQAFMQNEEGEIVTQCVCLGGLAIALLVLSAIASLAICLYVFYQIWRNREKVLISLLLIPRREKMRISVGCCENCSYDYFICMIQICAWVVFRVVNYAFEEFLKTNPFDRLLEFYYHATAEAKENIRKKMEEEKGKGKGEGKHDLQTLKQQQEALYRPVAKERIVETYDRFRSLTCAYSEASEGDIRTAFAKRDCRDFFEKKYVVLGIMPIRGLLEKFQLNYTVFQRFYRVTRQKTDHVLLDEILERCALDDPENPMIEPKLIEQLRQWGLEVVQKQTEVVSGIIPRNPTFFSDRHFYQMVEKNEVENAAAPLYSRHSWDATRAVLYNETETGSLKYWLHWSLFSGFPFLIEATLITALCFTLVALTLLFTLPLEVEHARFSTSTDILLLEELGTAFTDIRTPLANNVLSTSVYALSFLFIVSVILEPLLVCVNMRPYPTKPWYHYRWYLLYIRQFFFFVLMIVVLILSTFCITFAVNVLIWWILGAIIEPNRMLVYCSSVMALIYGVTATYTNLANLREAAEKRLQQCILDATLKLFRSTAVTSAAVSQGSVSLADVSAAGEVVTTGIIMDALSNDPEQQKLAMEKLSQSLSIPASVLQLSVALVRSDSAAIKAAALDLLGELRVPKGLQPLTLLFVMQAFGAPVNATEVTHELYYFLDDENNEKGGGKREKLQMQYDDVMIPLVQCCLHRSFDKNTLLEAASHVAIHRFAKLLDLPPGHLFRLYNICFYKYNNQVSKCVVELCQLLRDLEEKVPASPAILRPWYNGVIELLLLFNHQPHRLQVALMELLRAVNLKDLPSSVKAFSSMFLSAEYVSSTKKSAAVDAFSPLSSPTKSQPPEEKRKQSNTGSVVTQQGGDGMEDDFAPVADVARIFIGLIRTRQGLSQKHWTKLQSFFRMIVDDNSPKLHVRSWTWFKLKNGPRKVQDQEDPVRSIAKAEREAKQPSERRDLLKDIWLLDQWTMLHDLFSLHEIRPPLDHTLWSSQKQNVCEQLEELEGLPSDGLHIFRQLLEGVWCIFSKVHPYINYSTINLTSTTSAAIDITSLRQETAFSLLLELMKFVLFDVVSSNEGVALEQHFVFKFMFQEKHPDLYNKLCEGVGKKVKENGGNHNGSGDHNTTLRKILKEIVMQGVKALTTFTVPTLVKRQEATSLGMELLSFQCASKDKLQTYHGTIASFLNLMEHPAEVVEDVCRLYSCPVDEIPAITQASKALEVNPLVLSMLLRPEALPPDVVRKHQLEIPLVLLEMSRAKRGTKGNVEVEDALKRVLDYFGVARSQGGLSTIVQSWVSFCVQSSRAHPSVNLLQSLINPDDKEEADDDGDGEQEEAEQEATPSMSIENHQATTTTATPNHTPRSPRKSKPPLSDAQKKNRELCDLRDKLLMGMQNKLSDKRTSWLGYQYYSMAKRDLLHKERNVRGEEKVHQRGEEVDNLQNDDGIFPSFTFFQEICCYGPSLLRALNSDMIKHLQASNGQAEELKTIFADLIALVKVVMPTFYQHFDERHHLRVELFLPDGSCNNLQDEKLRLETMLQLKKIVESLLNVPDMKNILPAGPRHVWPSLREHLRYIFEDLDVFALVTTADMPPWAKRLYGVLAGIPLWYPSQIPEKLSALLTLLFQRKETPLAVLQLLAKVFPLKHEPLIFEMLCVATGAPDCKLSHIADFVQISTSQLKAVYSIVSRRSRCHLIDELTVMVKQKQGPTDPNAIVITMLSNIDRWFTAVRAFLHEDDCCLLLMQPELQHEMEKLLEAEDGKLYQKLQDTFWKAGSWAPGGGSCAGDLTEIFKEVVKVESAFSKTGFHTRFLPILTKITDGITDGIFQEDHAVDRQIAQDRTEGEKQKRPVMSEKQKNFVWKSIHVLTGALCLLRRNFASAWHHFQNLVSDPQETAFLELSFLALQLLLDEGEVHDQARISRALSACLTIVGGISPSASSSASSLESFSSGDNMNDGINVKDPLSMFMHVIYPFLLNHVKALELDFHSGYHDNMRPEEFQKWKQKMEDRQSFVGSALQVGDQFLLNLIRDVMNSVRTILNRFNALLSNPREDELPSIDKLARCEEYVKQKLIPYVQWLKASFNSNEGSSSMAPLVECYSRYIHNVLEFDYKGFGDALINLLGSQSSGTTLYQRLNSLRVLGQNFCQKLDGGKGNKHAAQLLGLHSIRQGLKMALSGFPSPMKDQRENLVNVAEVLWVLFFDEKSSESADTAQDDAESSRKKIEHRERKKAKKFRQAADDIFQLFYDGFDCIQGDPSFGSLINIVIGVLQSIDVFMGQPSSPALGDDNLIALLEEAKDVLSRSNPSSSKEIPQLIFQVVQRGEKKGLLKTNCLPGNVAHNISLLLLIVQGNLLKVPELLISVGVPMTSAQKESLMQVLPVMASVSKMVRLKRGGGSLGDMGITSRDMIDMLASRIFQELDVEHRGRLSQEALHDGLRRLRLGLSVHETKVLFDKVDVDGSGAITETEFKQVIVDVQERYKAELLELLDLSHESIYLHVAWLAMVLIALFAFVILGVYAFSDGSDFTTIITGLIPGSAAVLQSLKDPNTIKLLVGRIDDVVRVFFAKLVSVTK